MTCFDRFLFDGLTKLMRLDLSYNSIKHLDTLALDVLLQLTFLDLSHNLLDLGNTSQVSPMKSCSKLEQLLLSDNRIQIIYTDWITTMPNLKQLDLRRNKFTSVVSKTKHADILTFYYFYILLTWVFFGFGLFNL